MPKTFVNDDIFPSDGDYVIGGFDTDQVDRFDYSTVYAAFVSRLEKLVADYLKRAELSHVEQLHENPKELAEKDLALLISDNIGVIPEYTNDGFLIQTIIDSDAAKKWLFSISENFSYSQFSAAGIYKGVYNKAVEMSEEAPSYQVAKQFTDETTLEQLIEQLSLIEI